MRVQISTSSALRLLTVAVLLTEASSHGHIDMHLAKRHHQLSNRQPQPVPLVPPAFMKNRRSCKRKESESSALFSTTSAAASSTSEATSSSESSLAAGKHSTTSSPSLDTGREAAGGFKPVKPKYWPTATQSGPKPTSTRTSDADKYLGELSKAIDNSGNPLFTESHTGDMTYYGQSIGACGDQYDENSFTAAVSHHIYDKKFTNIIITSWPGASGEQNRNPICGPYVPARKILNSQGTWDSVPSTKTSVAGFAAIGGDGLLNCPQSLGVAGQCHIPLTATVTYGGKSVQVQIVDRCPECKKGDIDMTKTAFSALADWHEGRVKVTWKFDTIESTSSSCTQRTTKYLNPGHIPT
ncbi:hypothetical protein C8R46DRAFT_1046899 [Mycena filopes]|nr:hypothetical protein C8R46DRAFT_1046899 [Mycena filopes]